MARKPPEDPHVTDLRRYRKAREQARRRPPRRPPPSPSAQRLLGGNPRARLILGILAATLLALWLVPAVL